MRGAVALSTAVHEPSHRAMELAAEWYALLSSGEATSADRARWQSWLDHDPDHRLAWTYVEAVSKRFEPIQGEPDPRRAVDGLWAANMRVLQRRRVLASIAVLGGAGLFGGGTWRHTPLPGMAMAWRADHGTVTGEVRDIVLSDGTRVWLNTATAVNEEYSPSLRRLHLVAGEILVDTAADSLRPFLVESTQVRLRALGTRFTVRREGEATHLAVFEGAVEVSNAAGRTSVIEAGQQASFTGELFGTVELADSAREAWSRGVLVVQDIPLRAVVKELRRYRRGHLGVAPEVAELRVFGNFPLRDTDEALHMLATALPVRIQRTLPWWVSIEAEGRH